MKIEVGSTWVNKNDLDNTVTVDTVGSLAVTGHSDKDGSYMAHINDFLHYFKPLLGSQHESLSEMSEQEFESIIDEAFEEGYAQAYSEIQSKTERERALQEKAWDEGYDQAIDDLIESGVIGEEEYLDEDCSEEEYSEYEFGDVDDDEEEYCFSKELERVLNSESASNIKSDKKTGEDLEEYKQGYEDGKSRGITLGYNKRDYEYSKPNNSDEDCSDEEYCFFKELERVLDSELASNTKSEDVERKHSHYFKDVRHLDYIDIYEINKLFPIDDDTDCILHARKKLLVCGGRGGSKDMITDITDARDTLNRYLQIEGIE